MNGFSVKCQQCNNKTKNPSGLCYLHEGRSTQSDSVAISPTVPVSLSETSSQAESSVHPDLKSEAEGHLMRSHDVAVNVTDHGNGVATGEASGNLYAYSRVSEDDMERPDLSDEFTDAWQEWDRYHDDYISSSISVPSDSSHAKDIRENAHRGDFRCWSVGYKSGVSEGYSYTDDEGSYISRQIEEGEASHSP